MRTESTPKPEDDRANEALLSGDGVGLLDHVLAWSLRNRLLVIVLMVLVTLFGVRAAFRFGLGTGKRDDDLGFRVARTD